MPALMRLACAAAIAAFAVAAGAQPAKPPPRIGVLFPAPLSGPNNMNQFYQGLRDLGYEEGRNLVVERRFGDGTQARLDALAVELAQQKVDVIVALGPASTRAAHAATTTVPIVMGTFDAVEQGLIASYGRPGGNITGWSVLSSESGKKQLALLKEAIPGITRVAVISNPSMPGHANLMRNLDQDARTLGLTLVRTDVANAAALPEAFAAMRRSRVDAFFLLAEPTVIDPLRAQIIALAAEQRLPAIYPWRMYADAGGLMSYGPSLPDLIRRHAYFVHRILGGARPADLPVETPDRYELVLNLGAAKALGISFPPSLRAFATATID
ncbi:MAG: ABC transporter substrate-binding protein [Burkholderiales bacterium]